MESGGDLQKIEHQTLPPRKRAGWTGGGDKNRESNQDKSARTSPKQGTEGEQSDRGGIGEEHRGSSAVKETADDSGVKTLVDGEEKAESGGSGTKSVVDGDSGKASCENGESGEGRSVGERESALDRGNIAGETVAGEHGML